MSKRARKKPLPTDTFTATIESLTHDGRGVARIEGKAVFIDEALPTEQVEFLYTEIKKDYAEGKTVKVITAAEDRAEPLCPHYGVCGGCSFQHVKSEAQIRIKQDLLIEQFKRIGKVDIAELWQPLTGEHWGYRRKARMGVKYVAKKNNRVLVGFRERRNQFLAEIDNCIVMHPIVGTRLIALGEMIGQLSIRDKIPQIEVAIGDEQCVLAIRTLEPATADDIAIMQAFEQQHPVTLCVQPKGVDTIVGLDGVTKPMLSYRLPDYDIEFLFKPAMFTQVNYDINRKMINRALETLALTKDDHVLDLFCGLGNFTLPMARLAGSVVGVEGDAPLIEHAKLNAAHNKIENVEFYAADLSKSLDGMEWATRRYNKVLLDPSRAGASEVLAYFKHWQPDEIVYVSCNPSTLARDAGILVNELGYELVKAGVMDMFPQTAHVESIAWFRKA